MRAYGVCVLIRSAQSVGLNDWCVARGIIEFALAMGRTAAACRCRASCSRQAAPGCCPNSCT
eukprot:164086-Alexandrium_andersonii.AAC.1